MLNLRSRQHLCFVSIDSAGLPADAVHMTTSTDGSTAPPIAAATPLEEFALSVQAELHDLAHGESIDRDAREFAAERRGSWRGVVAQFRRLGVPRCHCKHLVLPWQSWVCDWEEWPQHHACWHSGLIENDTTEDDPWRFSRYQRRCRFCGWLTPRWAAAIASGNAPGDRLARDMANLIAAKLTAYTGVTWFDRPEGRLGGISPMAAVRLDQADAVVALVTGFDAGEAKRINERHWKRDLM